MPRHTRQSKATRPSTKKSSRKPSMIEHSDSESSSDSSKRVKDTKKRSKVAPKKTPKVVVVDSDSESSSDSSKRVKDTKKRSKKTPKVVVVDSDSESNEAPIQVPAARANKPSKRSAKKKERDTKFEYLPLILHRPVDAWDVFAARYDGKYIDIKKRAPKSDSEDDDSEDERIDFNMLSGYTHERLAKDLDRIQEELQSGALDGAIEQMYDRSFALMDELMAAQQ